MMESYTAQEIRRAYETLNRIDFLGEQLISKLDELKDHAHDWADDDMISVKEIRAAWKRLDIPFPLNIGEPVMKENLNKLLRDISEHREPEYPVNTVWKSRNGAIWLRMPNRMWKKFGSEAQFRDDLPYRPLRQMT